MKVKDDFTCPVKLVWVLAHSGNPASITAHNHARGLVLLTLGWTFDLENLNWEQLTLYNDITPYYRGSIYISLVDEAKLAAANCFMHLPLMVHMREVYWHGESSKTAEFSSSLQNWFATFAWQTRTTPNLARLHTPLRTDTGSSSTGTVRLQSVAGGQPQNPVALEPSRGPPRGQQGVSEQPLQPPTQCRVPQPPPPQAEFVSPSSLLEDSLKTLNDYWEKVAKAREEHVAEREATRQRLELEEKALDLRLRLAEAGGSGELATPDRETDVLSVEKPGRAGPGIVLSYVGPGRAGSQPFAVGLGRAFDKVGGPGPGSGSKIRPVHGSS
ncbi:hypothetical protein HPB50_027969 [Hyalomma asiaticum]|nr:hypothetical protein HPB50_027969 [Hyalomma asiaticum]